MGHLSSSLTRYEEWTCTISVAKALFCSFLFTSYGHLLGFLHCPCPPSLCLNFWPGFQHLLFKYMGTFPVDCQVVLLYIRPPPPFSPSPLSSRKYPPCCHHSCRLIFHHCSLFFYQLQHCQLRALMPAAGPILPYFQPPHVVHLLPSTQLLHPPFFLFVHTQRLLLLLPLLALVRQPSLFSFRYDPASLSPFHATDLLTILIL